MPPRGRDIELVDRAKHGDAAAFEQLYKGYRGFVLRQARRRLGNTDDAFDVLQDTFMKLFARFPGFELSAALTTVLYSTIDNLCRDRRARQRPTADIDDLSNEDEFLLAVPDRGGDDTLNLLAPLPPEQRELLTLRFVDDLSLPQLSVALGVPVGTIKSRLHLAILALRRAHDKRVTTKPASARTD